MLKVKGASSLFHDVTFLTNYAGGVVFLQKRAFIAACHGSSKTKDFEDAITHAQGGEPMARAAIEQVPAMRQHGSVAHRMSELRILQIAAGPDGRGQIMWEGPLRPDGTTQTEFAALRPVPHLF